MTDKRKRRSSIQNRLIVEVAIEEVVPRLEKLGLYGFQMQFQEHDDKVTLFEALYWYRDTHPLHIAGRLRRWEGTFTLLQFDRHYDPTNLLILTVSIGVSIGVAILFSMEAVIIAGIVVGLIVPELRPIMRHRESAKWFIYEAAAHEHLNPQAHILYLDDTREDDGLLRK